MFSNSQRIELVRRLQILTGEMNDIAKVLSENPCPTTDADIDRGVSSLVNQKASIVLTSLERQMKDGIPNTVLATYYPTNKALKAYAQETNDEALLVFQRLLEIGQYRIAPGDEDLTAYCLQLEFPNTESSSRLTVTSTEPTQPLVQVGPRKQIRQKVSDETLTQHLTTPT